jgi:hypothetical protein
MVLAVQTVSGLNCYLGGAAGNMGIKIEHTCDQGKTLCEYSNTTKMGVSVVLSKGCEMADESKKAVRRALENQGFWG